MDGLAALARGIFTSSQTFEEPGPSRLEACEVAALQADGWETPETAFRESFVDVSQLVSWHSDTSLKDSFHAGVKSGSSQSTIKIFVVHRDVNVSLHIPRDVFHQIFDRMGADPHALYFISCDYDGCHYWNGEGYRPTWFVGTSIYALLWTFDAATSHTAGIFIHRRRQTFQHFGTVLRAFARHAHVPQLLLFVIGVQELYWYDKQTVMTELSLVRMIEQHTGFGPHLEGYMGLGWARAILGHDIHKLTVWSQHIAELSGNLSNKMRHQRIAGRMLRTVVNSHLGREHTELVPFESSKRSRHDTSLRELSEAVPALETHMAVYEDYLRYLKERADRLSTVLFALLTHEDAEASIQLAVATRRDGSSMKTIAIMTMAFLPSTFFATFFSMPSRQGDAFWIFWVCAMPATAMVFVLWLGFSERRLFKSLQTRVDRVSEIMAPKAAAAKELFRRREVEVQAEREEEYLRARAENLGMSAKS